MTRAPRRRIRDGGGVRRGHRGVGAQTGRIIVTLDKDFGEIFYFSQESGGMLVLRPRHPTVSSVNSLLASVLKRLASHRFTDALVVATESKIRVIRKPH